MELLTRIGVVPYAIDPADLDETPLKAEPPLAYARRIAAAKAAVVAARQPGTFVLAADTVVAAGRRILPKAETSDEARICLALLSGRRHRVITAVTLIDPSGTARHRETTSIVTFTRLTEPMIAHYLAGGEWRGKAGGYAIQGSAEAYVRFVSGSYSGIVGLPLFETRALLASAGLIPALG